MQKFIKKYSVYFYSFSIKSFKKTTHTISIVNVSYTLQLKPLLQNSIIGKIYNILLRKSIKPLSRIFT
ncbi:hypothetical protein V1477_004663 [Vespula maculifrons]|uniref:Uncharacterized protein n=1 Tax=Vespula maculifrons TaxID=7453 RepID=A0ABD2CMG3_VESMC